MRHASFCAALLILRLLGNVRSEEDDSRCSYCLATAEVLGKRIGNERPRNHIDLRHRLDKEGSRYGKILDFRLSELRIYELLDSLSSELDLYAPVVVDGHIRWLSKEKQKGHNMTESVPEAELRHRRGLLKRWCESVIEKHEDAITDLLRSDSLSLGGIQDILCKKLTQACEVREAKEDL